MGRVNSFGFLFCMLSLFFCGNLLFLYGFFPISYEDVNKPSEEMELPSSIEGFSFQPPSRQYSRFLLIIVDALRYDFFTNSTMHFSYTNSCVKVQLKVGTPTVTMPRIKSLMAGSLSSFADIVFNLASNEQLEDSILHRIKLNGDIVIFAGDRTWIDLFPNTFKRQQANMDSFFVNDFYEGDKNVTKTLIKEINQTDWNFFIAHYLGLDHIGHVEGTTSSKIPIKLQEMDEVIQKIYSAENTNDLMILVTGDHGMRNGGGHGGSTKEEIYVPLFTLQKDCNLRGSKIPELKQIDLTPTLAILMSSKIPKQSIGCIIPDMIRNMQLEDQLQAYYYNAMHLVNKAYHKFGHDLVTKSDYHSWLKNAKISHTDFLKNKQSEYLFAMSKGDYIRASQEMSDRLAETLVVFKYNFIAIGIILCSLVTCYTVIIVVFFDSEEDFNYVPSFKQLIISMAAAVFIIFVYDVMNNNNEIKSYKFWLLTLPIGASVYICNEIFNILVKIMMTCRYYRYVLPLPLPIFACFIFHTFSLASSSFIEEEHQTWYYLGTTILIGLAIKCFLANLRDETLYTPKIEKLFLQAFMKLRWAIFMLLIIALIRRLNQTGDKWKHLEDFGDVLNKNENILGLSVFFILSLVLLNALLYHLTTPIQFVASILASLLIYCYRGANQVVIFFTSKQISSAIILPCFWLCIIFIAINRYKYLISERNVYKSLTEMGNTYDYKSKSRMMDMLKTNITCVLLISALLHKPHNVCLLFAMIFTLQISFWLCDQLYKKTNWKHGQSKVLLYKTVLTIFISKMFYFYQGNSNSLATIDLNPGYIGQSSYNPIIVITFVTLNTYSAQINAFLYLMMHMFINHCESLLYKQKKEHIANTITFETTEKDLKLVISMFTAATLLPTTMYLLLLIVFRYHLFIYSVFAPKALYESFNVVVFYVNFSMTNLYFMLVNK